MAPDPSYSFCSRGLSISNLQDLGTTRELRLVTLNCECIIDKGRYPFAFYSPMQQSRCSTLHCFIAIALLLHCFTTVAPHSIASLLSLPASLLRTTPNKGSIYSGLHLMGATPSPFTLLLCRAHSTLLLHLATLLLCIR